MEFIRKQDYRLGFVQENIELVIYSMVCFFVPFLIGHPQIIVGIIVNASLVLAALNLKNYKVLPIIILPSIAVLSKGLIFGPYTVFLLYIIPFIWIGNAILVYCMKYLSLEKKINGWVALIISSSVKTGFIFISAYVLVSVGILPALFLTTMGLFQLYTAFLGGSLAFGIHGIKKKIHV